MKTTSSATSSAVIIPGSSSRDRRRPPSSAKAGLGSERDDVALAAQHVRQRGADRVHGALEVHVQHLVEVLTRQVEERAVRADARVRNDDVDPAEALRGLVAKTREPIEVSHVARVGDDSLEAEVGAPPRGEAEIRAAVVQHAGDRGADAAARAGDDGGLAFQAHRSSFNVG
jgi:hypothetical protein